MLLRTFSQFEDVQASYQCIKAGIRSEAGVPDYSIFTQAHGYTVVNKETFGPTSGVECTFDVFPQPEWIELVRPVILLRDPVMTFNGWWGRGWKSIDYFELACLNLLRHAKQIHEQNAESLLIVDTTELTEKPEPQVRRICEHWRLQFHEAILEMRHPLKLLPSLGGTKDFLRSQSEGHFADAERRDRIEHSHKQIIIPQHLIRRIESGLATDIFARIRDRSFASSQSRSKLPLAHRPPGKSTLDPSRRSFGRESITTSPDILCTLGPATESVATLVDMIRSGMTAARFNYSHADISDQAMMSAKLSQAEKICGRSVIRVADLPGPKLRLGQIPEMVEVAAGEIVTLFCGVRSVDEIPTWDSQSSDYCFPVEWDGLPNDLEIGDSVYINDGIVRLKVEDIIEQLVVCTVSAGGPVSGKKGLNLPNTCISLPAVGREDFVFIDHAIMLGFDYIALSFVRTVQDIAPAKQRIAQHGSSIKTISKIEHPLALQNLHMIIEGSDAIMVARGDLAVEIPFERVPYEQDRAVLSCKRLGKPVIVATQMLESMTSNSIPTRAEVTDVWSAVRQNADVIMLSAESATGKHPSLVVSTMRKIGTFAASRIL